jgi:lipoate-protein ligase A
MNHLTLTLPTPAENLACDEALLDFCEAGAPASGTARTGLKMFKSELQRAVPEAGAPFKLEEQESEHADFSDGILRFWESAEYFVVVGYANKVTAEVNQAACAEMNVPILRRCSGGGTVLQGPGCLNYSLILPFDETGPLRNITAANQFIMERNRSAIETLLSGRRRREESHSKIGKQKAEIGNSQSRLTSAATSLSPSSILHPPSSIAIRGHTDLTLSTIHNPQSTPLKFSGNAQRRRKTFLLFHGTFLLNFDLALIEKLLLMPTKQPDYRQHRAHSEFLTNLHLPADAVKQALQSAWGATVPLEEIPHDQIAALTREKYSTAEWNFKF